MKTDLKIFNSIVIWNLKINHKKAYYETHTRNMDC